MPTQSFPRNLPCHHRHARETSGHVCPYPNRSAATTGSTLVQLAVDNEAGELFPGAFANVRFDLPSGSANLRVPASALIVDHRGTRVATIGPDGRVAFKPVQIARDLGDVIEISSGVAATDRIVDSPPDGIDKGDLVRIASGSTSGGMFAAAPTSAAGAGR
jgi:multidrug efflux pump subunit AcrA (membrane-fusion protein)